MIREIIVSGSVVPSSHARKEMAEDGLTMVDAVNVLRAGNVNEAEFENGSWRYRCHTPKMVFIVAFRSEVELRIVTA